MNHLNGDELEARAIELFTQSLELPSDKRVEWLNHQCYGNLELAEQVRRLANAEARSAGFLEQRPELALQPDRTGQQVGAYTIIDEHAIGGMSTVYRARRSDGAFEQQVAIKVFDASHIRGEMAARFDAERRILAALEHPGITRIIDGGEDEQGTPYVVMEWVEGEPITRYCNHQELDLPARLTLFARVCEALELAHQRGVVHRDIKSGNVLVNQTGEPKLIDFGIAKLLQPDEIAAELPETRLGLQLMTPEYASPEQIRGHTIGKASDIYSLGVLLYELLTGTRPHQLAGLSPAEIEHTVCDSIAIDPSAMVSGARNSPPEGLGQPVQLKRKLKGDLDRIVMTAMRHEPEQRYASVAAFSDDIQRYLANKPVRARGASTAYRAGKFIARHRAGFSATVIAFAALLTALVMVQIQATEARKQAERAESASQFLAEMIGRADPFENATEPTLAGALRLSIPDIAERFAGQPKLEADMRYAVGYALQNLGEIPDARAQLEQTVVLREQLGDVVDQAEAYDGMAIIEWWESDFSSASDDFQRALDLLEGRTSHRAQLVRINVLTNWSAMMIDAGDYEQSLDLAQRALSAIEQSSTQIEAATKAAAWSNLATAQDGLDNFDGSLEAFHKALAFQREATGEMNPAYAIAMNNMALVYYRQQRFDDAVNTMRRSVEIREQTLGAEHPQMQNALSNLARMLVRAGNFEAAEQYARRALNIANKSMLDNNPRLGKAHEAIALVLEAQGRIDEALEHAQTTEQIYQNAEAVNPAWMEAIQALINQLEQKRKS